MMGPAATVWGEYTLFTRDDDNGETVCPPSEPQCNNASSENKISMCQAVFIPQEKVQCWSTGMNVCNFLFHFFHYHHYHDYKAVFASVSKSSTVCKTWFNYILDNVTDDLHGYIMELLGRKKSLQVLSLKRWECLHFCVRDKDMHTCCLVVFVVC